MDVTTKTKQCVNSFNCRFKVALTTAIITTLIGIVAILLFGN